MSGVIGGGWSFVIAAYAVTAFVFITYTISLFVRRGEGSRSPRIDLTD